MNNVSLSPESDRWEHFSPMTIDVLLKYQPTTNITNSSWFQIEYCITMSLSNILILSIVNPEVAGRCWNSFRASYLSQI